MTPRLLSTSILIGLLVLSGGCSTSGSDAVQPSTATATASSVVLTADRLVGRWGVEADVAERRGVPWVQLDVDGTFTGFDGCNQVAGRWTLDETASTVASDVRVTTLKACPQRLSVLLDVLSLDGTGLAYRLADGGSGTMERSARPTVVMFLIRSGSLQSVDALLRPPGPDRTPQQRAVAGVTALLATDESGGRFSSLWGRTCGLATGVESVEPPDGDGSPAVVRLTGEGGQLCDLTRRATTLRQQQLAWTVVTNLGIDPATPVRVIGARGKALFDDVTPEPAYVVR